LDARCRATTYESTDSTCYLYDHSPAPSQRTSSLIYTTCDVTGYEETEEEDEDEKLLLKVSERLRRNVDESSYESSEQPKEPDEQTKPKRHDAYMFENDED